jgi:hypothetical protein
VADERDGEQPEEPKAGVTRGVGPRQAQPPAQSFDELLAETETPAPAGPRPAPVAVPPIVPPVAVPFMPSAPTAAFRPEPEIHEGPTQPVASYDLPTQAFTPVDMAEHSDWDEISNLLGGAQPVDVGDSAEHVFAPVATAATQVYRRAAGSAAGASLVATARGARRVPSGGGGLRILLYVATGLVLALVAIAAFAAGRAVAGSGANPGVPGAPATSSVPAASAIPATPATGPLPAGTYPYDMMRGGECLSTFANAWQSRYTVVDCAVPHAAQLVLKAVLAAGQYTAAYPGPDVLATAVGKLCSRPGVLRMSAAGAYPDVQFETAFPPDSSAWAAGDRTYYCYADLADGSRLLASIQGSGPKP